MTLSAAPIICCSLCGAHYRGENGCPICHGEAPLVDAAEFLGQNGPRAGYTGRSRMPGETNRTNRSPQVAAVDTLMAAGIKKTLACAQVGISPRTYTNWKIR